MIIQATIPPRPLADVDQQSWPSDPNFDWNGETTGAIIEMDAGQYSQTLRGRLEMELYSARLSWGGDSRQSLSRTPRFRNQAALTLWLEQQIDAGVEINELRNFRCVEEYPTCWIDLVSMNPGGLSNGIWATFLRSARCPACGITYNATDLIELEYNFFLWGEYVLSCPRTHHLFVIAYEEYQLGG